MQQQINSSKFDAIIEQRNLISKMKDAIANAKAIMQQEQEKAIAMIDALSIKDQEEFEQFDNDLIANIKFAIQNE